MTGRRLGDDSKTQARKCEKNRKAKCKQNRRKSDNVSGGAAAPDDVAVDAVGRPENILHEHAGIARLRPQEDIKDVDGKPYIPVLAVCHDHEDLCGNGRNSGEGIEPGLCVVGETREHKACSGRADNQHN